MDGHKLGNAIHKGISLKYIFSSSPFNKDIRNLNYTIITKAQYAMHSVQYKCTIVAHNAYFTRDCLIAMRNCL